MATTARRHIRRLTTLARRLMETLRGWEIATRAVNPEAADALSRRWVELPESVRTPAQTLGRHAIGCEGTHGVFPKCNLTCSPCYHSRDANKVRVDGAHTAAQIEQQMAYLRQVRGPRAHAQLIGGEVTLLSPEDHAESLLIMRRYGREPMSMTHGDVDYEYLRALAIGEDGQPRLRRLSFAAHFDSLMRGRRGIPRPRTEAELNPYRQQFCDHFVRLRREHGIRNYLAHNMTVTPANICQVADVIRDCKDMGFSMFSFQPAAFIGDDRRWNEDFRDLGADEVWRELEAGVGCRLPWRAVQFGDERCNRTAFGFLLGPRWVPLIDDESPADLAARDAFYRHLGGMQFTGAPVPMVVLRLLRVLLRHPGIAVVATRWVSTLLRRAGGLTAMLRHRIRPMTFVMHSFIDAEQVRPAWQLMQQGRISSDPAIRAAQERLQACSYSMAHPETGQLVPACVQHSVLDPGENAALRNLLPIVEVRTPGNARG
ncbi:hypothetical protein [Amycolatopsis sp. H20-H5]|uniref:hypothetical protein n=1 Tax=Amycolatopsis sp. H20-H5 TaxID=3046309 RepID=UPI002DC0317C|nr:hypothetical protein [Amycolatopsis sp. H20-H5]MEC3975840.1 hypothetical protein [Amycolatopsis sp. H20-H5]